MGPLETGVVVGLLRAPDPRGDVRAMPKREVGFLLGDGVQPDGVRHQSPVVESLG